MKNLKKLINKSFILEKKLPCILHLDIDHFKGSVSSTMVDWTLPKGLLIKIDRIDKDDLYLSTKVIGVPNNKDGDIDFFFSILDAETIFEYIKPPIK